MSEEILANPDYQLVMTFLQNITPGDMSPEAANQFKAAVYLLTKSARCL